ncbi:PTS galactosamine/N-acetylgalactosamine transporter subunit IIA [Yersinia alsatica]|uniref:PTS galactosamine/N-acetylgalactosamine transporter subunit IIA n=1 Tax=Yersinia alsatica TaxID=2890317 RepID=A0ABY5USS2_9GAMM|nr:PTS galactosamine/N-acetylgalactosamine transporter subunit IIA [Yersinia alsatica]OWF69864.1 PTS N-acetylgalactosamine transporter subunit IIA [Yersinia frederiksenii]UWM46404.1 PTS galactosamine/N-acetylgalactosamine transporter subunit IIA [Yersinia alsatica]CNI13032.1 putative phosphotransferase system protein [Yersinia frederiksenii]CNK49956.1 putative phosphotransferase system protein [Yersinia frederiksenii]CNL30073.1 putative phosphotransferase system protein [Yersinia frederiksenii
MVSIIITGHGHFASGLYNALEQIIGPQQQIIAIDFPVGMNTQQLDQALQQALDALPVEQGVVFFTDLLGGSPFRSAVQLSVQQPQFEVIAGTNMQMLAETVLDRDEIPTASEFAQQALAAGSRGIVHFVLESDTPDNESNEEPEGI